MGGYCTLVHRSRERDRDETMLKLTSNRSRWLFRSGTTVIRRHSAEPATVPECDPRARRDRRRDSGRTRRKRWNAVCRAGSARVAPTAGQLDAHRPPLTRTARAQTMSASRATVGTIVTEGVMNYSALPRKIRFPFPLGKGSITNLTPCREGCQIAPILWAQKAGFLPSICCRSLVADSAIIGRLR